MNDDALAELLNRLLNGWENEVVEFKLASKDFDQDKLGKYFSALANEANLRSQERGWLVFGVENSSRTVKGSAYGSEGSRLNSLKQEIANDTNPNITFREIHTLNTPEGRVVLFEIPSAPQGIPIAWKEHYYGRAGESLAGLTLDKLEDIRGQTRDTDWSARRIAEARLDHLDPEALRQARSIFSLAHANQFPAETIASWSDAVFLDRARLTIEGRVTAAALLLLGRAESTHLLSPHPV
jgi:ATP-dependent DNA helicase RecG